jgi:RNA polymerase sigma-70 factor, ECF subfamily
VSNDEVQLERFRPYLRFLVRVSWDPRLQAKCDPSDIIQQTLLQAHDGLEQYRGSTRQELAGWLRQILANVIRDRQRHFNRGKRDVDRETSLVDLLAQSSRRMAGFPADNQTPGRQCEVNERALRVASAMEKLPEDQEQALVLHYWHGNTVGEIAEIMGRSSSSVGGLLYRSVKQLRGLLGDLA